MFCDDVCLTIEDMQNGKGGIKDLGYGVTMGDREALGLLGLLLRHDETVRHAIDRTAFDLMHDLTLDYPALERCRRDLFLPHPNLWFEYALAGVRMGMLVISDPLPAKVPAKAARPGRSGYIVVVCGAGRGGMDVTNVQFDLDAEDGKPIVTGVHPSISGDQLLEAQATVSAMLLAFCAAMGTPRLVDGQAAELGRLNVARERKRKPRLLEHSVIRLTRTAAAAHAETRPAEDAVDGPKRAWHRVRAFMRVRLGHIEFVRPHTRGSRDVGVKTHVRVTAGRPIFQNAAL